MLLAMLIRIVFEYHNKRMKVPMMKIDVCMCKNRISKYVWIFSLEIILPRGRRLKDKLVSTRLVTHEPGRVSCQAQNDDYWGIIGGIRTAVTREIS